MIVFIHIPRTGGTSLRSFIRNCLPPGSRSSYIDSFSNFAFKSDAELAQNDFLATHCGYGIFHRLPANHKKVIILRDPVERVISLYHNLRRLDSDFSYASPFAKSMTLEKFVACDNPAVSDFIQDTQTWQLFFDKSRYFRNMYADIPQEALLGQAIHNLATFDYIGFTSSLNRLAGTISASLALENPGDLMCLGRSDASLGCLNTPNSTLDIIRERVRLDIMLYEFASARYGIVHKSTTLGAPQ